MHTDLIKSNNFILTNFTNQKPKTKTGSSFSDFLNIIFGIPQALILGPRLFIIYICAFFIEYDAIEFANYEDNTTPCTYGQSFNETIEKLAIDMAKICESFHHSGFKANPEKFYFLLSPFLERPIKIMESTVKASK